MNFNKTLILLCIVSLFFIECTRSEKEIVYKVAQHMPRFHSDECEKLIESSLLEAKRCASDKMLEFVYEHLKYPIEAKKSQIADYVIIGFYIDKNGVMQDAKILRDIGGGCGAEALRVVKMMTDWVPGVMRGKKVSVNFNLPIHFKLGKKKNTSKLK